MRRSKRLRKKESKRKVSLWKLRAFVARLLTCCGCAPFCDTGLKVLKSSGILDAYQGLLVSLCKYGLPTEDLYEFSALTILKHEKKLKAQRKKELEDRLKQRYDQK